MQEQQLTECPFCGNDEVYATTHPVSGYCVCCDLCCSQGPCENDTASAIAAWNRRAGEDENAG